MHTAPISVILISCKGLWVLRKCKANTKASFKLHETKDLDDWRTLKIRKRGEYVVLETQLQRIPPQLWETPAVIYIYVQSWHLACSPDSSYTHRSFEVGYCFRTTQNLCHGLVVYYDVISGVRPGFLQTLQEHVILGHFCFGLSSQMRAISKWTTVLWWTLYLWNI